MTNPARAYTKPRVSDHFLQDLICTTCPNTDDGEAPAQSRTMARKHALLDLRDLRATVAELEKERDEARACVLNTNGLRNQLDEALSLGETACARAEQAEARVRELREALESVREWIGRIPVDSGFAPRAELAAIDTALANTREGEGK